MKYVAYEPSKLFGLISLSSKRKRLQALSPSVKTAIDWSGKPSLSRRWQLLMTGSALALVCSLSFGATPPTASISGVKPSPWKFNASVAVKEAYDSNVYLQSQTTLADQGSYVSSLLPQLGLAWQPNPKFGVSLNYLPEIVYFHSEPSEDYTLHRTTLALGGKLDRTKYEVKTSVVLIDGSSVGPTWTGAGGAPAAGGPAVRDRRDATVYRSSLFVTQDFGKWFVQPSFSFYLHDFQTDHRATPGYQNYVDRSEIVGGSDVGTSLNKELSLWAGYRYGIQDQAQLLLFTEEYDSTFHRALLGVEGHLFKWCKIGVTIGPEFRHYGNKVPVTFGDRSETLLYVDATATITPTKTDTFTLSVKRFEQPGFGGRSTYDDFTCDLNWKHKFDATWTVGLGGRAYNTDFLMPVVRNDWILSANAYVSYNLKANWNAEVSYGYENGLTRTANASGREYERHLIALGIKYIFR